MTSKERVKRAIEMRQPDRIPLLYAYSLEKSDIVNVEAVRHFTGENGEASEWGFVWSRIGNGKNLAMGIPKEPIIKSWDELEGFRPPDPYDPTRFDKIRAMRQKYGDDKYYKANLNLSGFSILSMLRGFDRIMEDMYNERENFEKLADIVFGFEEEIIGQLKKSGYDAVGLADDWGMQNCLFISPGMWRELFLPRYKRQIELAHSCGLDVYMHSCGYIFDIIPDLIEIGLDILNPGQPDINGVKKMGERFGGRICFACPVSYQTTGLAGGREEIFGTIGEYKKYLGGSGGGLIGIIPEDSKALGLTQENLDYMEEAFLQ